jgi:hypothetical protein
LHGAANFKVSFSLDFETAGFSFLDLGTVSLFLAGFWIIGFLDLTFPSADFTNFTGVNWNDLLFLSVDLPTVGLITLLMGSDMEGSGVSSVEYSLPLVLTLAGSL